MLERKIKVVFLGLLDIMRIEKYHSSYICDYLFVLETINQIIEKLSCLSSIL